MLVGFLFGDIAINPTHPSCPLVVNPAEIWDYSTSISVNARFYLRCVVELFCWVHKSPFKVIYVIWTNTVVVILNLATISKDNVESFFKKINLEDISHFRGATHTSVLDFRWCLPWVSKPEWIPCLRALSPACNWFLRFTSSATPADLLAASIVAKPVLYPHTCMSHVERNHRNIRLVLAIRDT